ncbi:DCC1-like thiol-disulfide oxidoreductase family protein [Roseomonas sp. NAR14]|uniref:DCC1-like thiol-disulfide oxidoreductase family protein n=1 Tax=Roseomonas acroporae TaxID=2937791 RepID=A0A9X2BWR8_9PROT|nr:DCC1-like thiol-disulfide oxidoreductase family protein [Roseomonas acroporae]MCK8786386.1 DCC1-like thiol-disulfide oxidoreductase family protein [Roseomonas acroporae]
MSRPRPADRDADAGNQQAARPARAGEAPGRIGGKLPAAGGAEAPRESGRTTPGRGARAWHLRPLDGLPGAAGRELDGLILFDGVCLLCARSIRFVAARDRAARFRFASVQSPAGRPLAERLGIDPAAPESVAVLLEGRALFKSDAAIAVLRRLPGWGWVRLLGLLPCRLRDGLYDRVAGSRYRLFGRSDACPLPGPELRRRILPDGLAPEA